MTEELRVFGGVGDDGVFCCWEDDVVCLVHSGGVHVVGDRVEAGCFADFLDSSFLLFTRCQLI